MYIDTGSPVLYIPSKSRDLAGKNNKILTEWKCFETTVLVNGKNQRQNRYLLYAEITCTINLFVKEATCKSQIFYLIDTYQMSQNKILK